MIHIGIVLTGTNEVKWRKVRGSCEGRPTKNLLNDCQKRQLSSADTVHNVLLLTYLSVEILGVAYIYMTDVTDSTSIQAAMHI